MCVSALFLLFFVFSVFIWHYLFSYLLDTRAQKCRKRRRWAGWKGPRDSDGRTLERYNETVHYNVCGNKCVKYFKITVKDFRLITRIPEKTNTHRIDQYTYNTQRPWSFVQDLCRDEICGWWWWWWWWWHQSYKEQNLDNLNFRRFSSKEAERRHTGCWENQCV